MIAPVLDAMVPALGRLGRGSAGDCAGKDALALVAVSRKLVSMPRRSRNSFTVPSCERIWLFSTLACCAMVAPPSTSTPEITAVSSTQTRVRRSA